MVEPPNIPIDNERKVICNLHRQNYDKEVRCAMHPKATGCYKCHLQKPVPEGHLIGKEMTA